MIFDIINLNQMGIWFGAVRSLSCPVQSIAIHCDFPNVLHRNSLSPACWGAVGYNALAKGHGITDTMISQHPDTSHLATFFSSPPVEEYPQGEVVFRIPEMLPLSLAKDTKQQTK